MPRVGRARLTPALGIEPAILSDDAPGFHSRLNPDPSQPVRFLRTTPIVRGVSGAFGRLACMMYAIIGELADAVPFPLDDEDIDPDLFQWSWGVVPPGRLAPALLTPNRSSIVQWTFTENDNGLWLLTCWRNNNGASSIPIECVVVDP